MNKPDRPSEAGRIIHALVSHGVDFVVCGGAACLLHGVQRITADIDLFVRLDNENLRRFVEAGRELRFQPRIPEPLEAILDPGRRQAWIMEKGAKVSTYSSPEFTLQVDVFLEYPIPYDRLLAGSNTMKDRGVPFRVSSIEHLIEAKRQVQPMRRIDQRDIDDLTRLQNNEQA